MAFKKAGGLHIDGRKEMSLDTNLVEYLNPETVYIPLIQQSPLTPLVKAGDKVKMGTVVAERVDRFGHPVLSSVSGEVVGIKKVWHSSGKMLDMIEIKNDFLDEIDEAWKPIDLENITQEELISVMKQVGLVGLGGAGFPTYAKYGTGEVEHLIINLVECEPFITSDFMYAINNPEKLVLGLKYMMKAAKAKEGVIVLKDKPMNKPLIEAIEPFVQKEEGIRIQLIKDIYPAGWEKYIVEQVSGKTYQTLPIQAGCVVNNSSTAITFYDALCGIPFNKKVITITGEGITKPQNFLVKIGTPVKKLVEMAGGYIEGLDPLKYLYIAGGPMTGRAILIDELIVSDTLGAVIVTPNLEPLKAHPACLGCGKCSEHCPAHLTPTVIKKTMEQGNVEELKELGTMKCVSCGLCSYVCPSRIELTDAMEKAKDMVRKAGR